VALSAAAKARLAAQVALGKKADGLVVLDLQAISGIADFFVICSGGSSTQVRTIADAIEASLKEHGFRVSHREGMPESGWLLLDYGDVVVHVFLPDTRDFYALERLWGDAPELTIEA
jgi:ribosome-associated protein